MDTNTSNIVDLMNANARLLNAVKLARIHIMGSPLEHAIVSLDHPSVGLGGYLAQVVADESGPEDQTSI